jgi:Flp pilus assembly pilin Flp
VVSFPARRAKFFAAKIDGPAGVLNLNGDSTMVALLRPLFVHLKDRFLNESGQDLVEYALIVAMLSFCAVAAERNVAVSISGAFLNLANTFNADL